MSEFGRIKCYIVHLEINDYGEFEVNVLTYEGWGWFEWMSKSKIKRLSQKRVTYSGGSKKYIWGDK